MYMSIAPRTLLAKLSRTVGFLKTYSTENIKWPTYGVWCNSDTQGGGMRPVLPFLTDSFSL